MINLTKYIPKNKDWMKEAFNTMGEEKFGEYYNRIFLRLYDMKKGEWMNIVSEVKPDNYSIFINCLCAVIDEMASYDIMFSLEEQATMVRRY